MIELILIALGWVGWVRLIWRAPWWALLMPRHYRRLRRQAFRDWARQSGWCARHGAFAGQCADTMLAQDGTPLRRDEWRVSPHGLPVSGWFTFGGHYVDPHQWGAYRRGGRR